MNENHRSGVKGGHAANKRGGNHKYERKIGRFMSENCSKIEGKQANENIKADVHNKNPEKNSHIPNLNQKEGLLTVHPLNKNIKDDSKLENAYHYQVEKRIQELEMELNILKTEIIPFFEQNEPQKRKNEKDHLSKGESSFLGSCLTAVEHERTAPDTDSNLPELFSEKTAVLYWLFSQLLDLMETPFTKYFLTTAFKRRDFFQRKTFFTMNAKKSRTFTNMVNDFELNLSQQKAMKSLQRCFSNQFTKLKL